MSSPPPDRALAPHRAAYEARLVARRAEAARRARWDAAVAWARLAVFAGGVVLAWLVFKADRARAAWMLAPLGAFVGLLAAHDRVIRARAAAERAVRLYEDGLGRMEDRWPPGDGRSARFADEEHLSSGDLDLFGAGSLFERLSVARTGMGEETLAAWLKAPAPAPVVRARQQAVAELAPRLDLREDLAVLGEEVRAEVNPRSLLTWAASAPSSSPSSSSPPPSLPLPLPTARVLAALLGVAATAALLVWLSGRLAPALLAGALLLAGGFALRLRPVVAPILIDVHRRAGELRVLSALLARLESERFAAPLLVALRASLDTGEGRAAWPPSRRIARLARLVGMLEARRNQLFGLLVAPLLWTTQLALAVEAWRRAFGPAVARWLAAAGEIEALVSLATWAYEHPELPFPELAHDDAPLFEAEGLAHPLLPAAARVANDVVLSAARGPRLLLVSGSNMSGKSTLLRTVGANVVLALAGAPVCARRLRLTCLVVGGTLRIHDSLQEGRSRFYAEITRLRQIVDRAAGPVPVLFLVDEMLSGTNSHDRRIGAEAVLRTLLDRGAVGLATTHDLALAAIADALGPGVAANVHFEDEVRDGRVTFDYRMRPGVVRKSNALALMRAVGLDVGAADAESPEPL